MSLRESSEPTEPPPPSGPPPRLRAVFPWFDRVWHDWRADPVDRFGVVLFFVIATIVVSSLVNTGESYGDSLLAHTMSGLALLAAARATGMRRRGQRVVAVVVVLAIGVLAALSLAELVVGEAGVGSVNPRQADPLWVVLVIAVPVLVIRRIAQHTIVGGRTVLGAITAYLQIGVAYAALFQAVGVWSSVPPFGTPQESSADMYLSMTTCRRSASATSRRRPRWPGCSCRPRRCSVRSSSSRSSRSSCPSSPAAARSPRRLRDRRRMPPCQTS